MHVAFGKIVSSQEDNPYIEICEGRRTILIINLYTYAQKIRIDKEINIRSSSVFVHAYNRWKIKDTRSNL